MFKSEIHDCSLMLIRFLFSEKLNEDMLKGIETAKKQRIDLVYYTDRILPEEEIKKNIETAPSFVLTIEKLISEVNEDMINIIRKELKKYGNDLDKKEEIIILTKTDVIDAKEVAKQVKKFEKLDKPVFTLSLYDDASVKNFQKELIKILKK